MVKSYCDMVISGGGWGMVMVVAVDGERRNVWCMHQVGLSDVCAGLISIELSAAEGNQELGRLGRLGLPRGEPLNIELK